MTTDEAVVHIHCLEHTYTGGVRIDLCGAEFHVPRGQRVAVLGPNGSGKSTLLKHILGILKPTQGQVRVFGEDPAQDYARIRQKIGAVMQNVDEQLIGPTVFDDVAFAPLNFGFSREETRQRVEGILESLDITHLRDRLPHYLSGGEKKKVALAGALVFGPELLILDEPLEGVDYSSRREICAFLRKLHAETGMTIISTMHDMDLVSELADVGYIVQSGGRLDLYGTITELFFEHDLSQYNLAPPGIAQLVKQLNDQGMAIPPTFDVTALANIIMARK
ncbi:MAG: energy-coupling factor ABC transporter ATP-binding protein [Armatimonadota bacterium]